MTAGSDHLNDGPWPGLRTGDAQFEKTFAV
jgi:hypothetical protein